MATYGLMVENERDELVLSDSGITYSFVGRATFVSITPPGTSATLSGAGFSTYTIDWPGQITVALPVKTNGGTVFRSAVQSGNTWTITVHKSNGASNSLGFDEQEQTEVYVFGAPGRPPTGTWGVFLFDDAGNVLADLSRRPLSFLARISTSNDAEEWAFPGGTYVPLVIGTLAGGSRYSAPGPNNLHNIRTSAVAWRINSSTGKLFQDEYQIRFARDDAPGTTYTVRFPFNALLVDGTGL